MCTSSFEGLLGRAGTGTLLAGSGLKAMKEIMKSLGAKLRQLYGSVVERPMSWPIIDALERLDDDPPSGDEGSPVDPVSGEKDRGSKSMSKTTSRQT